MNSIMVTMYMNAVTDIRNTFYEGEYEEASMKLLVLSDLMEIEVEKVANNEELRYLICSLHIGTKRIAEMITSMEYDEQVLISLVGNFLDYVENAVMYAGLAIVLESKSENTTKMNFTDFMRAFLNLDKNKKDQVRALLRNEQEGGDDDDID